MLVRRLASGNLGAFRFSGENFQAVPIAPAIRPSPQFRLNYLKCPILLAWIDDVPVNGNGAISASLGRDDELLATLAKLA